MPPRFLGPPIKSPDLPERFRSQPPSTNPQQVADAGIVARTEWPGAGPYRVDRFTRPALGERVVPNDLGSERRYVFPGLGPRRPFMFMAFGGSTYTFALSGVTRDSIGVALPICVVHLFRTGDNSFVAETISDGSGNYSFVVGPGPFFVVAYKTGSPDVSGTTLNTLMGS